MVPVGLSPRGESVALHRNVGAMISKEIYIKRKNVPQIGGSEDGSII